MKNFQFGQDISKQEQNVDGLKTIGILYLLIQENK